MYGMIKFIIQSILINYSFNFHFLLVGYTLVELEPHSWPYIFLMVFVLKFHIIIILQKFRTLQCSKSTDKNICWHLFFGAYMRALVSDVSEKVNLGVKHERGKFFLLSAHIFINYRNIRPIYFIIRAVIECLSALNKAYIFY